MADCYIQNFKSSFYDIVENNSMNLYASNSFTQTVPCMDGILLYRFKNNLEFIDTELKRFMEMIAEKYPPSKELIDFFLEDINCINSIFNYNIACSIQNRYLPYAVGTVAKSVMPPAVRGRSIYYCLTASINDYNEFKKFKIGYGEYEDFQKLFKTYHPE